MTPEDKKILAKQLNVLLGFGRGLTADLAGSPADLANATTNLLKAGYGYAGNKLGLLKPEQMPELTPSEDVPLTSDWLTKGTPLQDPGNDMGYTAGRFLGGFAGPLAKAANIGTVGRVPQQSQRGALYRGDKSGIMAVHATDPEKLVAPSSSNAYMSLTAPAIPAKLRNELYQTSFGLTKEEPGTSFGGMLLIPNPHRVDPKTSPSVIRATDFFSPRYNDSHAGGGFEMGARLRHSRNYAEASDDLGLAEKQLAYAQNSDSSLVPIYTKRIAQALEARKQAYEAAKANDIDVSTRYHDRFGSAFSDGGVFAEGLGTGSNRKDRFQPQNFHQLRMNLSPRFQNLEHYAESPYGGKLLTNDSSAPYHGVSAVEEAWNKTLYQLRPASAQSSYGSSLPTEEKIKLLQKIAKGQFPKDLVNDRTAEKLGTAELIQLQDFSRGLLQKLKTSPSDYGEIKRFGSMGLNGDNFVGALNLGDPSVIPKEVLAGFASRKIPYFDMSASPVKASAEKILDLQDSVFHRKIYAPRQ